MPNVRLQAHVLAVTHQHGRRLVTGSAARGAQRRGNTVRDTVHDAIAHGPLHPGGGPIAHITLVGEVGEGGGTGGGTALVAGVVTVQDGGQLLTGDIPVGLEGAVGVAGHDAVLVGPSHSLAVPLVVGHVAEAAAGAHVGGTGGAVQDGDHHGAGQVLSAAKLGAGGVHAVHQAVVIDILHGVEGPVISAHVSEGQAGGRSARHESRGDGDAVAALGNLEAVHVVADLGHAQSGVLVVLGHMRAGGHTIGAVAIRGRAGDGNGAAGNRAGGGNDCGAVVDGNHSDGGGGAVRHDSGVAVELHGVLAAGAVQADQTAAGVGHDHVVAVGLDLEGTGVAGDVNRGAALVVLIHVDVLPALGVVHSGLQGLVVGNRGGSILLIRIPGHQGLGGVQHDAAQAGLASMGDGVRIAVGSNLVAVGGILVDVGSRAKLGAQVELHGHALVVVLRLAHVAGEGGQGAGSHDLGVGGQVGVLGVIEHVIVVAGVVIVANLNAVAGHQGSGDAAVGLVPGHVDLQVGHQPHIVVAGLRSGLRLGIAGRVQLIEGLALGALKPVLHLAVGDVRQLGVDGLLHGGTLMPVKLRVRIVAQHVDNDLLVGGGLEGGVGHVDLDEGIVITTAIPGIAGIIGAVIVQAIHRRRVIGAGHLDHVGADLQAGAVQGVLGAVGQAQDSQTGGVGLQGHALGQGLGTGVVKQQGLAVAVVGHAHIQPHGCVDIGLTARLRLLLLHRVGGEDQVDGGGVVAGQGAGEGDDVAVQAGADVALFLVANSGHLR